MIYYLPRMLLVSFVGVVTGLVVLGLRWGFIDPPGPSDQTLINIVNRHRHAFEQIIVLELDTVLSKTGEQSGRQRLYRNLLSEIQPWTCFENVTVNSSCLGKIYDATSPGSSGRVVVFNYHHEGTWIGQPELEKGIEYSSDDDPLAEAAGHGWHVDSLDNLDDAPVSSGCDWYCRRVEPNWYLFQWRLPD